MPWQHSLLRKLTASWGCCLYSSSTAASQITQNTWQLKTSHLTISRCLPWVRTQHSFALPRPSSRHHPGRVSSKGSTGEGSAFKLMQLLAEFSSPRSVGRGPRFFAGHWLEAARRALPLVHPVIRSCLLHQSLLQVAASCCEAGSLHHLSSEHKRDSPSPLPHALDEKQVTWSRTQARGGGCRE